MFKINQKADIKSLQCPVSPSTGSLSTNCCSPVMEAKAQGKDELKSACKGHV